MIEQRNDKQDVAPLHHPLEHPARHLGRFSRLHLSVGNSLFNHVQLETNLWIDSFGIPPSIKRWIEEEGLQAMGENKASYMAKSMVDKMPEADQDVNLIQLY